MLGHKHTTLNKICMYMRQQYAMGSPAKHCWFRKPLNLWCYKIVAWGFLCARTIEWRQDTRGSPGACLIIKPEKRLLIVISVFAGAFRHLAPALDKVCGLGQILLEVRKHFVPFHIGAWSCHTRNCNDGTMRALYAAASLQMLFQSA